MNRRQEFLELAKKHYAADMLIKATYGEIEQGQFKGCSVGCFLYDIKGDKFDVVDKHQVLADWSGLPVWLHHLQDTLFEGLPNGDSAKWHVQLAETIAGLPAEYDWQAAMHRVHVAILRVSYKTAGKSKSVVESVIDLHERAGRGEPLADELWSAVRSAAYQEIRDAVLIAIAKPE